ncbi:hypothetical protein HPB49_024031 [Dermacentor silvarum]|uniref:Uncharacterized protein n=1 Tax=Dermacentor silvarum TaxID=543639 RepID=A0ACB8D8S7_DERSI|nr:hypothetical protein HPB49_024031 [Dermacentor silvarum]
MAYQVSGIDLPAAEFNAEEWSEVLYARTRSPRQQSKETERTQSSKAASADGTQARKTASAPSVPSEVDGTAAARLRIRPLPRLPVDDFKIVFRPSAGVNLAQYNDGELRAAVLANSGLHSAVAEEDLMCTNLPKNIFTVSTSCADRVANYAKIRDLTLRGNKLAFHAYIAPPDGARPGIIYRAWSGESPQDLLRELRRANPLLPIVQARDMGRTSRCVLIHLMAEELPPSCASLRPKFHLKPIVDWDKFCEIRLKKPAAEIQNYEEWASKLQRDVALSEKVAPVEHIRDPVDSRLLHLWEAYQNMEKRWLRQKHNRKLKRKMAQTLQLVTQHAAELSSQQWTQICNRLDGTLCRKNSWSLLRHMLDPCSSRSENNKQITKLLFEVAKQGLDLEAALKATYFPDLKQESTPTYTGAPNSDLDAPITEAEIQKPQSVIIPIAKSTPRLLKYSNQIPLLIALSPSFGSLHTANTHATWPLTQARALVNLAESDPPSSRSARDRLLSYHDLTLFHRNSRLIYPPPHKSLPRSDQALWRRLQTATVTTPFILSIITHGETSPHCHLCPSTRADFAHIFLNCPSKPKPPWRGSEHQERWEAALRSSQPDLQLRTVGWARGVAEAQMCPAI